MRRHPDMEEKEYLDSQLARQLTTSTAMWYGQLHRDTGLSGFATARGGMGMAAIGRRRYHPIENPKFKF